MSPQCSDPLKVQYEKHLLLGCITADRARELPSPLLSKLIHNKVSKNHIPSVVNLDGNISILQAEISNTFHFHFAAVYTPKLSLLSHFIHHIPSLPPPFIASLSNLILISNMLNVAAHSKKNSAPRLDGIPYYLYAQYPLLQTLLVKVIQVSISTS